MRPKSAGTFQMITGTLTKHCKRKNNEKSEQTFSTTIKLTVTTNQGEGGVSYEPIRCLHLGVFTLPAWCSNKSNHEQNNHLIS